MLNYTMRSKFATVIYGMFNMEAIPKFDIKSVIKFDISIKPTTWSIRNYEKNTWNVRRLVDQKYFNRKLE